MKEWLNRYITFFISMNLLMASSGLHVSTFVEAVQHFKRHQQATDDITLSDFITLHYSIGSSTQSNEHDKLPIVFKTPSSFLVPVVEMYVVELVYQIFSYSHYPYSRYAFLFARDLLRPPKSSDASFDRHF